MQDTQIIIDLLVKRAEESVRQLNSVTAAVKGLEASSKGLDSANKTTSASTNKNATSQGYLAKAIAGMAGDTDRASKSHKNFVGHIAKTTVLSAGINQLFLQMIDVTGQAIQNVDLMNNFPATMASMGQSTERATVAFQALRDYVGQIGGNLGDATSYVTRFTGATGDVKAATAIFVGLNNALIAGDSSLEEQRGAMLQFAQALERGKIEAKEWNILTQNMSFQLTQVAKSMGYVSSAALREAMVAGKVSMAEFTVALTKMSTGTGDIVTQAEARMNGMQFAFNRMKNTMVQGLASVIDAIGRQNIVSFFSFMAQVIQVLTSVVLKLISALITLFNFFGKLFGLPTIKLKKDVEGVADGIGSGAANAGDLKDGLDDAGDSAKKLNKSLASFDKMNVLPDKESASSGKDKKDAGGAGAFDAGQLGELGDLFDGIGGKMEEASKWAKIFAGILTGIVGIMTLLKGIRWFNQTADDVSALSKRLQTATDKAKDLGKTLKDSFKGADTGADKTGKGIGDKIAAGIGKSAGSMSGAIAGFVGGIAAGIGTALGPAMAGVATAIVTAIGGVLAAGAAALGVSVGVFVAIIAAVIAAIVVIIWLIWTNWDTIWKFITDVFTAFWDFLVSTWNALYDIFKGPVEFVWQLFSSIFILIVAIVATALELMFKLVVGTIKLVYDVLSAIAVWVFENVIKPVADFFVGLWKGIVDGVTAAWNWIFENVLRPIGTWIYTNVISPVVKFFKDMWDTISGFVSGFFGKVKEFMMPIVNWIKLNIIDKISGFFSGLWDGIKNGLSGLMTGLRNIFDGLAGIFKSPMNGVIDILNSMFKKLNETIKVPDWVPGLGGKRANFPMIPRLAKGGIVEQATLAMVGENGKEAVVPLENNLEWIDKLAAKINTASGGSGQPIQLTVQIGEDKIASQIIDLINEKTQMSGRNMIYV